MQELVRITEEKFGVKLDLRYASNNNVTGQPIYKKALCYLHQDAVKPFQEAIKLAKRMGYKFKIWDFFRPFEAQVSSFKWNQEKSPDLIIFSDPSFAFKPDPKNPRKGLVAHCRGVALDLTLIDNNGQELEMGTDFDDLTPKGYTICDKISAEAQKNRMILRGIMTAVGFEGISNEWWHFQLPNPRNYKVLFDKDLSEGIME